MDSEKTLTADCRDEVLVFEGFGTSDDFENLGGDGGLSNSVCREGEFADHFSGVVGRTTHGGHSGSVFGSRAFEQGLVGDGEQVFGKEKSQEVFGCGFESVRF